MIIDERYKDLPIYETLTFHELSSDNSDTVRMESVLHEHLMDIYVNEVLTMKVVCLANHLAYMVLGRLLTEGIIESAEDVEHIYVCEYGRRARVYLRNKLPKSSVSDPGEKFVEITPTCCTNNHILNDYFVGKTDISPLLKVSWKKEWVFSLSKAFEREMPLYSKTRAAHSCILAQKDQILFTCEDLGRHNAMDNVIGYALAKGIPLSECILYTSGRVPTDMTIKAIRAGVPVLASKTAPTVESVALAREYGLTLIGFAKNGKMQVF